MMKSDFLCKKSSLDQLQEKIEGKFDLLICAASFEERCLSVPLKLSAISVNHVVVLKNDDVAGAGAANAQRINEHFINASTVVETTKSIAIRTADRIAKELDRRNDVCPSKICVDITCMTHETLLILFCLLTNIFDDEASQVLYLYCPAKEYSPGVVYENKWLSRGIKDVRSVLGYPGRLLPSRKNRLLVLVGFEVNRTGNLINVYEPASLSLGYGDGTLNSEHQIVNKQKHERLLQSYPQADKFEFSPRDPYQVRDLILEDANAHSNLNLIVAPMNSKISTIGAALATLRKPEIQLCYAPAATYNFENYSEPDNYFFSFQVQN